MFVYALSDPRTGEIRYIGQTVVSLSRRLRQHLQKSALKSHGHKNHWLKELLAVALQPCIHHMQTVSSLAELDACEIYWIAFMKAQGNPLTNGTTGGEGLRNPSAEVRARMSAAKKGKAPVCAGHKTPEHRESLRQANLGKKASAETRAKMSTAHKGQRRQPPSVETRAKMSQSAKARCFREKLRIQEQEVISPLDSSR